ncbi:hypothetical protein niasHT_034619 [Heterodera trifolii]|uniref:Uncharacterized protein n=1 Tax=Heterodera trifolii TaxID=157864 RepID=A0ABD2ILB6_9BILA
MNAFRCWSTPLSFRMEYRTLSDSLLLSLLLILDTFQLHFVCTERVILDEAMPKVSAQYDYFGSRLSAQQPQPYGSAMGYGGIAGGDMVNFDFQCKCQAKSALAKTLSNPLTDQNQATQQHIQQLQEQVRKLQEQINRSQQGKTAFEQFAQVLSLADGLDCNCSGASTPWMGWPSGVIGGGPKCPIDK